MKVTSVSKSICKNYTIEIDGHEVRYSEWIDDSGKVIDSRIEDEDVFMDMYELLDKCAEIVDEYEYENQNA